MNFRKRPWRHDPRSRNFSHHRLFGTASPLTLPDTLGRPLGPIENQGNTLRCTGYGSATNGYYIHRRRFSPDWQAAKVGQIQGKTVDGNGGDPNACMKSMRDYGFLPLEAAPYSLAKDGVAGSGWDRWTPDLDKKAIDHIGGFVRIDGPADIFDNIRSALFKAYDPKTKTGACVDAFGAWYYEWTYTPRGFIPSNFATFAGYHRYIFVDWKTIDGVPFLIAQNSYGVEAGDKGLHYFPRDVVNREFSKWGTSLKIVKTLTADQIALAKEESIYGRIQRAIFDILFIISEKFGL